MGSKTTGGDSSFHVQLASIVEVLANTAVAEICKLVDDGYALLHLEISQNHREIDTLRRRLLLAKLQGARRGHATARTRVETHGALQATRRPSPRVSVRSRSGGVAVYFRTTGKERLSGGTEEEDVAAAEEEEEEEPVIVKVEGRGAQDTVRPSNHTPAAPGPLCDGPPVTAGNQTQDRTASTSSRDHACYWESYPAAAPPPVSLSGGSVAPATSDGEGWAGAGPACGEQGNVVSGGHWGEEPVPVKEEGEAEGRGGPWLTGGEGLSEEEEMVGGGGEMEEEGGGGDGEGVVVDATVGANRSAPFRTLQLEGGGRSRFSSSGHFKMSSAFTGRCGASFSLSNSHQQLLLPPSSSWTPLGGPGGGGGGGGGGSGALFRCDVCGKSFTKFPSLRRHERVHTGEKPFSCRHCAKRFSHSHQLKNHERVHTGEKPFRCHVCGRCFAQSNHMKRHLRTHGEPNRCR